MCLKEKITAFPKKPGVYIMKDVCGEVLYVGKAKNLRERVKSYFKNEARERYQIKFLMERVADIEFTATRTEKEALLLEYKLIQEHRPRYNIDLKDNKAFLSIKLSRAHPFPGIYATRKIKKDNSEYFGPYTSAGASRETLDQIVKFFKLRICSDREFANRCRPCLQYDIGRCLGPCVNCVSKDEYKIQVENARLFLRSKKKDLTDHLKTQMRQASEQMCYEEAKNIRDLIKDIKKTLERQRVVKPTERFGYQGIGETLQRKFGMKNMPHIIECVDISNIGGKIASGSIVAFVNGEPEKSRYRLFNITRQEEPNDYAMMYEVLERRFRRTEWGMPDLLMVDGGKGQLNIALKVLENLKITNVPVIAIAKPSRIYVPNRINPIFFHKNDKALLLLIRIRDEAHRFGIGHYRRRHVKRLSA